VWGENPSSEQHSSAQAPNAAAVCCTQGEQQRAQQGKQQRQRRAAAVASSSSSRRSVQQAASGKINAQRGTAGRGELRSTTPVYEATLGAGAVAGSISIQIQQQRRAASSSNGERRAAAATESSLVQARKSGLTKANIDPQTPSTVVLQARAQLRKRSLQYVGNTNARVTGSHLLWLCSRPVSTAAE
jgi:hypothetical protein